MSGLAEVTSPPYDVIAHDKEEHFLAADPHNVIRLILPRAEDALPGNPYHQVADELASWLADGILAPDPEPALYVYEQMSFPPPGQRVQRGLIGALGLVPLDAGVVWPHEGVAPGPIGRRQLMEATQANLEPIFLLYHGSPDGAATRIVEEAADPAAAGRGRDNGRAAAPALGHHRPRRAGARGRRPGRPDRLHR